MGRRRKTSAAIPTITTYTTRYRSFLEKDRSTIFTYASLMRKNTWSNFLKKGRRKKIALSEGSCPGFTGLSREAQSTGVRMSATTTERSIAEMTVTENWR